MALTHIAAGLIAALLLLAATPAYAHVKWFAPFLVGAQPRPIIDPLTNTWFWAAIALVVVFFVITVAAERTPFGAAATGVLDTLTRPLWGRADDATRVVIGGFFIAIFAVGGIYLTPDLTTEVEAVSWLQLVIAACVFWRWTMPVAAAGILLLWIIALRDYDLFHLLDYLALGLGVAGYLTLAALPEGPWRARRFEVLRWGVAIALMWSSLEKFAYPEWFYPLVEERPFLTFGLPRDVFIPMAGVAEFTMGFGLLWTPLVRRLSAIALLVIFVAAVYPFGRTDFVGHALIMGVLVLILSDPTHRIEHPPPLPRALALVPAGLVAALVIVGGAYWGLHAAFYTMEGAVPRGSDGELLTHRPSEEHPHGAEVVVESPG